MRKIHLAMIHPVCKDIIGRLRITKFVETGTHIGETVARVSRWFAGQDPDFGTVTGEVTSDFLYSCFSKRRVGYPVFSDAKASARSRLYTVDTDAPKQRVLQDLFAGNPNIRVVIDSSERFLKSIIDKGELSDRDNCLFYLDSHWNAYWPLRDEIRQILRLRRSVIVIDDFVVPRRPLHLFSVFNGKVCGWYYIRDLFRGRAPEVYYPRKSNEDFRGTVIIFIGYPPADLAFMNDLPCFRARLFKGDIVLTLTVKLAFLFFHPLMARLGRYFMHNVQRKADSGAP